MAAPETRVAGFARHDLPGLRVHVRPDPRFKRVTAVLAWQMPLAADTASPFALLPRLLRRGTRRHPDLPSLERALAELYGASLGAGVEKMGDRHLATLSLTWPAGRFVPGQGGGGEDLAARAMGLLMEVFAAPYLEGDAFPAGRVAEEREAQIQRIRALVNDKATYALRHCLEHLCAGEPYGISELGDPQRLAALDGDAVARLHRRVRAVAPLDLFVTGPVDPDRLMEAVAQAWEAVGGGAREVMNLPPAVIRGPRPEPKRVEETLPMEQGWLILGLRAPVGFDHPLRPALEMYNGILGGFVHSKLFLNVRERASLAYTAWSRLVRGKGLIMAMAGIDPRRRADAEAIMLRQIEDMAAGRISDDELEATRRSLVDRIRSDLDRPGAMIRGALESVVYGHPEDPEAAIAALQAIGRAEVQEVARQVGLDTVYFLHGGAAAGDGEQVGAAGRGEGGAAPGGGSSG
ncbi:peptidase M16 domain protein [Thermaerobacter marianensis DSM 12885]|uniref:Peptidase M16 domain protein n=1 Tax=Thermaerobacter marianensis (strain ATCC 700841 / DSM 12885 / JCM 10246 / 7p75a) TaxID=644966 RepID=E6SMK5_THEM7|nr:pitrilysin family protein [Thermaerobacter marianensis]ADU51497.1 peptidase M16 domain protein [Thermaerobacter marianensis DSM 12885]